MKRFILCIVCLFGSCAPPRQVTREDIGRMFFPPKREPVQQSHDASAMSDRALAGWKDSVSVLRAQRDSAEMGRADAESEVGRLRALLEGQTTFDLSRGKTVILEGVTFQTNSSNLTGISESILGKARIALELEPAIKVEIAGYTDDVGDEPANLRLSLERATVVKEWLVSRGVEESRLTAVGMGSADPIAPNDTQSGRAQNRRIEFHVLEN